MLIGVEPAMLMSDVAQSIDPVRPETPGGVVYDRFTAEPDTLVIAVVDRSNRPVGLVERNAFAIRMGGGYGRALYAGRPISIAMTADPLVVEAATPVASFTGGMLTSRAADLLNGFIVVRDGVYVGVGHSLALLQATCRESARQAQHMTLLATELDDARLEAQSAGRKLRDAIEAMPEGVAYLDAEGRFVLFNERYAELHARSARVLREGAGFEDVLRYGVAHGQYPEAEGREEAWVAERLGRDDQTPAAHEQRLADDRWVRIEERALSDGGRIGVAVEITELKRREASFRLLFDNSPVAMCVWEVGSARLTAFNAAARLLYGLQPDGAPPANVYELLVADEHARFRDLRARRRVEEYLGEETWRHRRAGGGELLVEPFVRPMTLEGRECMLAALIDVTDRERHAGALQEARDAAEASSRAKSEFLANMSHEIRTPMNGVIGVADALARTDLTTGQSEMVDIMRTSAGALQALLSDILDLARVEAGGLSIAAEPFDLGRAVNEAATLFAPRAREKGLSLTVEAGAAAGTWLRGDVARLKQILFNLLSNAVKFTETGDIRFRVSAAEDGVVFEVCDTGVGFDPSQAERMFGRFQQADGSITRRYGGSGLGLAISRDLAERMGGTLDATSQIGRGSSFRLRLPLPPVEAQTVPSFAETPCEARPLCVLLADDHPNNRRVVELILGSAEVELVSVEDGEQAVEAYGVGTFDCVLMDLQMPVMDGLTAIRAIRGREAQARWPRTPILALSANALPEHVAAAQLAGADGHLAKPITADALLRGLYAAVAVAADRQPAHAAA